MGAAQRGQGAQLRNFVGDEMSDLRKAAQEALEALEYIAKDSFEPFGIPLPGEIDITMDALRAALAQPEQEPVAVVAMDVSGVHMSYGGQYLGQKPDTKIAMLLKDLPVGTHLYVAVGMGVSNE